MVNKIRYSLSDVIKMDQYLMSLAAYEASEGMLSMPYDMDSALEFQSAVTKNFRNFKRMIKRDECTIDEIEQMVISKHGPIINPYRNMTTSQALDAMANEPIEEPENIPNLLDLFMESIKTTLQEGSSIIPIPNNDAIILPCQFNPQSSNVSNASNASNALPSQSTPPLDTQKENTKVNKSSKKSIKKSSKKSETKKISKKKASIKKSKNGKKT